MERSENCFKIINSADLNDVFDYEPRQA
jgi:hypothetical protein